MTVRMDWKSIWSAWY